MVCPSCGGRLTVWKFLPSNLLRTKEEWDELSREHAERYGFYPIIPDSYLVDVCRDCGYYRDEETGKEFWWKWGSGWTTERQTPNPEERDKELDLIRLSIFDIAKAMAEDLPEERRAPFLMGAFRKLFKRG